MGPGMDHEADDNQTPILFKPGHRSVNCFEPLLNSQLRTGQMDKRWVQFLVHFHLTPKNNTQIFIHLKTNIKKPEFKQCEIDKLSKQKLNDLEETRRPER